MTPDTQADLALRLVELYEKATEPRPSGHLPLPLEVATYRASLVRYAQENGLWRLFQCARDGGLDLVTEQENAQ